METPPSKLSENTPFTTINIQKPPLSDYILTSPSKNTTYRAQTSLYNPSKPDILLYFSDAVVGSCDLKSFSGNYVFSLSLSQPPTPFQVKLERVPGWSSRHSFIFRGERFVWRHKGEMGVKTGVDWEDLECVTDREDDEEEVLVAQYCKRDPGYRGWKGRGCLRVREMGEEEGWERVVVLGLMALLVTRRREQ